MQENGNPSISLEHIAVTGVAQYHLNTAIAQYHLRSGSKFLSYNMTYSVLILCLVAIGYSYPQQTGQTLPEWDIVTDLGGYIDNDFVVCSDCYEPDDASPISRKENLDTNRSGHNLLTRLITMRSKPNCFEVVVVVVVVVDVVVVLNVDVVVRLI